MKKLISAFIAMTLIFTVFTGCGETDGESTAEILTTETSTTITGYDKG